MRYQNNDRLREYLGRGAAGAYREHLRHPSFELDDAAFAATLAEVLQAHPQMSRDDAEARAVFRMLTSGTPPAVAVALPSRWYRVRAWARRAAPRAWWWLKLAWAVSVLILAAIAAHAEPDPQPANLVSVAQTMHALEIHPPQLFQLGNAAARVQFLNSGTWSYVSSGNPLPITCVSGCSAAGAFADNSAFTVGTTAITPVGGYYTSGADPSLSSGNAGRARIDAHSYLFVDCAVGCGGGSGGTSLADEATFTQGTTNFTPAGCLFNSAITNLTSGQGGAFECTNDRNLFVNLNRVGGSALALGQTTMANSLPVTLASNQSALSVTATNAYALDSSVNGILNAQGSTTSGEKGPLAQCAVTTSAPSYTTAQTDPLSCGTGGLLRVDGSGVTQPVSGSVTANAGTGQFNVSCTAANCPVNVAQVAGSNTSTAATGTQLVGLADGSGNKLTTNSTTYTSKFGLDANLLGTLGTAFKDAGYVTAEGGAADGSSVAGNPIAIAGKGSGDARVPIVCDNWTPISLASTTALKIVTKATGKNVYICSINLLSATAQDVALVSGTLTTTNCDTSTAGLAGGTTAATGWNFAANGGIAMGTGIGVIAATASTGLDVCLFSSSTGQISGGISWTQF